MLVVLVLPFTLTLPPAAPLLTGTLLAAAGGLPAGAFVFLIPRALGPASALACGVCNASCDHDTQMQLQQDHTTSVRCCVAVCSDETS